MPDQTAVDAWLAEFVERLRATFGDRLAFVAQHGSWARGEAHADSDMDALVVVDRIADADLAAFREVIASMPEGGRMASGLFSSVAEMRAMPRHQLYQYFWGCTPLHGSMGVVVAAPSAAELLLDVRVKASTNLHVARHYLLFPHDLPKKVHALHYPFKECFYALHEWMLVQRGEFFPRKDDLLAVLTDADDRAVVTVARDWRWTEDDRTARPLHYIELLERWSRRILERVGPV